MGSPQEAQTGTMPVSFFFTTASPIFPRKAPLPVGLGGAPAGAGGRGAGGAAAGVNGLAAGAAPPPWPAGDHTPGLGAVKAHTGNKNNNLNIRACSEIKHICQYNNVLNYRNALRLQ